MYNWKIIGVDLYFLEYKVVVDFVNKGILEILKIEDGKYINIVFINMKDLILKEEIILFL